ncbi:asparaginyl-tRNA synthetase-like isoform X2 [Convolutriloba macropyga]|uniref:asparaginyl-tRNA synthetase-like isoform X2 n=1 Tax=Convolutriloba macropyga TaxID=536237 RepID=UPI003F523A7A
MKNLAVKTILVNSPAFIGKRLRVSGSVQRVRHLKDNYFIVLHDGSSTESIQVVVPSSSELASKIASGDILQIEGELVLSPAKGQAVEIISHKMDKIAERNNSLYPLVNTHKMALDSIRKYPHLQSRTQYFQNMMRLRDAAEFSFHDFYRKNGFVKVTTPIITSNDCEGAGECFNVTGACDAEEKMEHVSNIAKSESDKEHKGKRNHFFAIPTQLTVSGQLHLESLISGLHNVYTLGPAFRAEHSRTIRHLSEFYMVEAELAYIDSVHVLMDNVEHCLKFSIDSLLNDKLKELQFLWSKANMEDVPLSSKHWRYILESDFVRLSFAEAIGILNNEFIGPSEKGSRLTMKSELLREHELFLTEKFNLPVFVYNYPKQQKAFYVRENESSGSNTCASFDLLVPRVSELVGGSVRENRIEKLEHKMKESLARKEASSVNALDWYLDLRRFGSIPHGGYGIGFERYLLWLTGSANIRNTIPFPRHIDYCPM